MKVNEEINHFKIAERKFVEFCSKNRLGYKITTDPDDDEEENKTLKVTDSEGRLISSMEFVGEHEEFIFYIFFITATKTYGDDTFLIKRLTKASLTRTQSGYICTLYEVHNGQYELLRYMEGAVKGMIKRFFGLEVVSLSNLQKVKENTKIIFKKYNLSIENDETTYTLYTNTQPKREVLVAWRDEAIDFPVFEFLFYWAIYKIEVLKPELLDSMDNGYLGIDTKEVYLCYKKRKPGDLKEVPPVQLATKTTNKPWCKSDIEFLMND